MDCEGHPHPDHRFRTITFDMCFENVFSMSNIYGRVYRQTELEMKDIHTQGM